MQLVLHLDQEATEALERLQMLNGDDDLTETITKALKLYGIEQRGTIMVVTNNTANEGRVGS